MTTKSEMLAKSELLKKTKKELFEIWEKLKELEETDKVKQRKRIVKHILYECNDCKDAKFRTQMMRGVEIEILVRDCREPDCKYKDEFKMQMEEQEDEIENALKKFLKA